ncbi:MAG TPA: cobalamin-independent methionine synthase II family protein [Spirochaetia bacterium]|nr:cobalamin-independent methionine synthase II family protein [Spirochaetia bacterium]
MSEIKTTVVGSYPVPEWLRAYPSRPNLRDAILAILKTQELAGIDVITDGELSRWDVNHPDTNGMIENFIAPLGGVRTKLSRSEVAAFRSLPGMEFRARPAGVVEGPVTEGLLGLVDDWNFIRGLAATTLKFTVTSPYMLAKTLVDQHYGDLRTLTAAIAEALAAQVTQIDAPIIQVDEANLPGNPDDASWAHAPINVVLDAIGSGQGRAMHFCFGNYGGQSIQHGTWETLLGFFNNLHLDHLVLEFARHGYDQLARFRELREDIALGIGVIDIKDNEVETPELVAERIEGAVKILGANRVKWVHPDCGFWMLPRSVADRKMAALVAGRDLVLGR